MPFRHFQASGAEALVELRVAFSKVWLKRFFALAEPLLTAEGKACPAIDAALSCDELYNGRRDAEGVPYNRAVRTKEPAVVLAQAAFVHHLPLQAGATREGLQYLKEGTALANVLCRRLRSANEEGGRHFELRTSSSGTAEIGSRHDIYPMPKLVLRQAQASKVFAVAKQLYCRSGFLEPRAFFMRGPGVFRSRESPIR